MEAKRKFVHLEAALFLMVMSLGLSSHVFANESGNARLVGTKKLQQA